MESGQSDAPACSHYGVITFSGDPDNEHPDAELRGKHPLMEHIACGPEAFCWDALARWTTAHPLRMWEEAEVLARDPANVLPRARAVSA